MVQDFDPSFTAARSRRAHAPWRMPRDSQTRRVRRDRAARRRSGFAPARPDTDVSISFDSSSLPRHAGRAQQMRHQEFAPCHVACVVVPERNRAGHADDFPEARFDGKRETQHGMHVARLHEAVVVIAAQQLGTRKDIPVSLDGAGTVRRCPLAQDVVRAPHVEVFALAREVDPDRDRPAFHRVQVAVDQADIARAEYLSDTLERGGPAVERRRGVVDRIENAGECRFVHAPSLPGRP